VLTSDHGESLGARGVFQRHGWLYDVGLHVPLIVKFPKAFTYDGPVKGKVDNVVRTIDILPTVLDTLSIESPSYIEGKSLLGVKEDRICVGQQATSYALLTPPGIRVLFNSPSGDLSEIRGVEIFDVRDDPFEEKNLFEDGDAKSAELLQLANELHSNTISLGRALGTTDQQVQALDEDAIRNLKALGYLGD
jgi:hypothetical protein